MRETGPVVFLTDDLSGGGAERAFVHILSALRARRPELDLRVLLLKRSGAFLPLLPEGVPVEVLAAGGGYLRKNASRLAQLIRWQRRHRPRAIVSFMFHMNQLMLAAAPLTPPCRRIAVEQCAVGVDHRTGERVPVPAFTRFLMRRLYARADRIVTISSGISDELNAQFGVPAAQCRIIPNPVDWKRLAQVTLPKRDPRLFTFAFLGRFVEQKNLPLLLRAFASLSGGRPLAPPPAKHARQPASRSWFDRLRVTVSGTPLFQRIFKSEAPAPAIRLKLIGEGRLEPRLRQLAAELGIAEAITWTGFLAEPWQELATCDALALSSNFEGMGNVIIEAWSLGLPVVGTACDFGPAELIGADPRLGTLTPVKDAAALACAMRDMVAKRETWRKDAAWRREYARRFSLETVGAAYEEEIFREAGEVQTTEHTEHTER